MDLVPISPATIARLRAEYAEWEAADIGSRTERLVGNDLIANVPALLDEIEQRRAVRQ